MSNKAIARQLEDLQQDMLSNLSEMKSLLRSVDDKMIYERARQYWLAHIELALTKDTMWLGGSMVNCDDTLQELNADPEEYDDEDDE